MTTHTATAARRVTRATMADAVTDLAPFTYNRSASAEWTGATRATLAASGLGSVLDRAEAAALAAHVDGAARVYLIRSYGTPLAAYVPGVGWWTWDRPYTSTTNRHRALVRDGIARVGN